MPKWVATPQPAAVLLLSPGTPVIDAQGNTWTFYHTANHVNFAKVVSPTGLVIWRKEILTA